MNLEKFFLNSQNIESIRNNQNLALLIGNRVMLDISTKESFKNNGKKHSNTNIIELMNEKENMEKVNAYIKDKNDKTCDGKKEEKEEKEEKQTNDVNIVIKHEYYKPLSSGDNLFWAIHLKNEGKENFDFICSKKGELFKTQQILKNEYITEFKRCYEDEDENLKECFKEYKWKRNAIESGIFYDQFTIDVFTVVCFLYDFNVIIFDGVKYCEYIRDTEGMVQTDDKVYNADKYLIIKKGVDKKDYQIFRPCIMDCPEDDKEKKKKINETIIKEIQSIRKNLFLVCKFDKPMRALSAYKKNDLVELCQKVGISYKENSKDITKKEMYFKLNNYLLSA